MIAHFRPAVVLLLLFSGLTGVVYPLLITGIGQALFTHTANGSLIEKDGVIIGSSLIGQTFIDERYFWPRPSAAGAGYDAAASSGSNLGPTSKALMERISGQVAALKIQAVPADAISTSASGLDPHISPVNALMQVERVAAARGLEAGQVTALVEANILGRDLGILGEPRINVLTLNMQLDALTPKK